MGCFIAPATEAVVTTIIKKTAEKKEHKSVEIPFSRKMKWLTNMLWGGSALLAFEHIWHGEVTPFFPFLTAMGNAQDTAAMLQEIATAGTAMALLVTAVWAGMLGVVSIYEKRANQQELVEKA